MDQQTLRATRQGRPDWQPPHPELVAHCSGCDDMVNQLLSSSIDITITVDLFPARTGKCQTCARKVDGYAYAGALQFLAPIRKLPSM